MKRWLFPLGTRYVEVGIYALHGLVPVSVDICIAWLLFNFIDIPIYCFFGFIANIIIEPIRRSGV